MVFSRRLTRGKLLDFFTAHPRCVVALEACGGAHHWAREPRRKPRRTRGVGGRSRSKEGMAQ
jgi:transposase